jgi:NAD(P)H-dependent flavin oxidoreductase YrpB (nitropropane dioxygenase family)
VFVDRFFARGREFLGSRYPILCGAITWVSDPQLVSAVCEAGGFGLLAGGNAPPEVLRVQILETRRMTSCPFGVNVITLAPNYPAHLKLACDLGCEFVVFVGGIPKKNETLEFGKLQMELLHKLDENIITREEAQFEVERFWVGSLRKAVIEGDVVKGSIMAGQSVGLVNEIKPLKAIVDEMIAEAEDEFQRLNRELCAP